MTEVICHLDPLILAGFIDGWLEPEELKLTWAHLDECPECVSFLADVVRLRRERKAEEKVLGLMKLTQEAESTPESPG